jgi:hypothetical protein
MKLSNAAMHDILAPIEENVPFTGKQQHLDAGAIKTGCSMEEVHYAFHVLLKANCIEGIITRHPVVRDIRKSEGEPTYHAQGLTLAGHRLLEELRTRTVVKLELVSMQESEREALKG